MAIDAAILELVRSIDFDRPVATIETIRTINPHRYEFEMLTAVVYIDSSRHRIVGYKDVRLDEFWVRGHMPGYPLFPGVLMCEAAAQLAAFYYGYQKIGEPGVLIALGGIDEARFVRPVRPGERLVLVGTGLKVHRRMTKFHVLGLVGEERAFATVVSGMPIGKLAELQSSGN